MRDSFLSTSPAWGTTVKTLSKSPCKSLSIHVPRVGDDRGLVPSIPGSRSFYPRPPRGGRPGSLSNSSGLARSFYPRPPRGGRLAVAIARTAIFSFLSTSPAWGTTVLGLGSRLTSKLSIHVPRVGDDHNYWVFAPLLRALSIHVPRVGDDLRTLIPPGNNHAFYPRPPRGGRRPRRRPRDS